MENLKPCPKCHSDNGHSILTRRYSNCFATGNSYYIRCDDCGYEIGGGITEQGAVKIWNNAGELKNE